ncbi:MAG: co-chaperone GroES [bacterium]
MNLKPIGDHIILKTIDEETVTASGIIIPDTVSKERPEKGEVLAVGPGKMLENGTRQAIEVAVGNKVIFKKYAPDEVEVAGEKYLIINADDVMAVIG